MKKGAYGGGETWNWGDGTYETDLGAQHHWHATQSMILAYRSQSKQDSFSCFQ